MLPDLTKLLQLQERDQRLRQLQKDLKDIPKLEAVARGRLAGDQAAVESASARAKEVEVKIKGVELDIQTRQNTIKRLHDQQFETRKNDEFQALGNEVERYKNEVRVLEDKELEHMEALEQAKAVLKEAQAKLGVTQSHVDQELKALTERTQALKQRLAELEAERSGISAPVDPGALDLYTRLFAKKPDAAIVPLENGICGGCHMKVVSGTVQSAKAGEAITQCESCGRIVYWVE